MRLLTLSSTVSPNDGSDDEMQIVQICAMAKGTKYFVSGYVGSENGRKLTFVLDSAADISVVPPTLTGGLELRPLTKSFRVDGFSGDSGVVVNNRVDLEIKFAPGILKASFYVCDSSFPIIGTDLLQNKVHQLSLETGTNVFKIGHFVLKLKNSRTESEKELARRQRIGFEQYRAEYTKYVSSTAWLRSVFRVKLQPLEYTIVRAYVDSARPVTNEHTFSSFFDTNSVDVDDVDIHVQSINFEEIPPRYLIPVGNRINEVVVLPCDFVFGEILNHPPDQTHRTGVDIFPLQKMLEEVKKRNQLLPSSPNVLSASLYSSSPSTPPPLLSISSPTPPLLSISSPTPPLLSISSSTPPLLSTPSSTPLHPSIRITPLLHPSIRITPSLHPSTRPTPSLHPSIPPPILPLMSLSDEKRPTNLSASFSVESESSPRRQDSPSRAPIPFSTIVNKRQLPTQTIEDCRERGVKFDLDAEQPPPEVMMERLEKIDVEAERKKQGQ